MNIKIQKIIGIVLIFLFLFLLMGSFAFAAKETAKDCYEYCNDPDNYDQPEGTTCICNPSKYGTLRDIIQAIADFIFWLAIPITSLMVVIGGVMFMTSSGKPEKVEQAKKLLLYSVIGLAIILLSRVIAAVIENILA